VTSQKKRSAPRSQEVTVHVSLNDCVLFSYK